METNLVWFVILALLYKNSKVGKMLMKLMRGWGIIFRCQLSVIGSRYVIHNFKLQAFQA